MWVKRDWAIFLERVIVIIGVENLNLHSEKSFFRRSTDLTKFDERQTSDLIGDRLVADLENVWIFLWDKKPVNGSQETC